jgi:predicted methyltransferase
VLTFLGLSNGVRAFVVERDPGYFGAIIGAAIGNGRVTELLPPAALQDPAARAAVSTDIGLAPGLTPLVVAPAAVRLASASLDFVLLDLALDRLSSATAPDARAADIAAFIQKLFSAVRPGGIVGVVGDPAPSDDTRADAATGSAATKVRRDFVRAGFILDNAGRLRGDYGSSESVAAADDPVTPPRFILKFRKPE